MLDQLEQATTEPPTLVEINERLMATRVELLGGRLTDGREPGALAEAPSVRYSGADHRARAELPFGLSEEQSARLTGIPGSQYFTHDTLNAVDETATLDRVLPDTAEIGRRVEAAQAGS